MKIAFVVGSFPHVSETFIVNQIVGMAARGHDVDIYTTVPNVTGGIPAGVRHYGLLEHTHSLFGPHNLVSRLIKTAVLLIGQGWRGPRLVWRALNIMRYGRVAASLGLLVAGLTLRRQQRTGAYDVIHCQFGTYGEAALPLREIGAITGRLVTSFRGFDASKYLRTHPHAYDALFREGDLFLPVSRSLADRLVASGCERAKIVVLHSGIECGKFRYIERRLIEGEPARILTIGRLTEKKGIAFAIRAVARIIASGRDVSFTIVGEGPLRDDLQRLCEKLGVSKSVQLVGWRTHDEVVGLIETAHVLLAPSVTGADGDEEGIPNSVKEAMATGMPVVSTSHGGIPELVEDGVSGYLVAERDVEAMADRLQHVIDHPQTWAAIGQAARARVVAEFDTERLNDELERLYSALTAMPIGTDALGRSQAASKIP